MHGYEKNNRNKLQNSCVIWACTWLNTYSLCKIMSLTLTIRIKKEQIFKWLQRMVGDNPAMLDTVLSDNPPHKCVHNDSEEILLRTHSLD